MQTHDDFLRTIIANAEDDGPRLVYADWLEEQGECDYAEFIRLSIQVEELPLCKEMFCFNCPTCEMCQRIRFLHDFRLKLHSNYKLPNGRSLPLKYRRGCPYGVECDWDEWLDDVVPRTIGISTIREGTITSGRPPLYMTLGKKGTLYVRLEDFPMQECGFSRSAARHFNWDQWFSVVERLLKYIWPKLTVVFAPELADEIVQDLYYRFTLLRPRLRAIRPEPSQLIFPEQSRR